MSARRARRWALVLCLAVVGWVLVAAAPAGAATGYVTVSAGSVLNVRSGPSMSYAVVRTAARGAALSVTCQVSGQSIAGAVRTTSAWDRLADGSYVSDAYVSWPSGAPGACGGASARVTGYLNQRANASTVLSPTGSVGPGGALDVTCQLNGETISGTVTTNAVWDRLSNGRFVSDAYVAWAGGRPSVPWCDLGRGPAPASGQPFIDWAAPQAQQTASQYRVPASVTIAQAILESGWGRSALTTQGNSFFGMKCFGTPGPIALGCRSYQTYECQPSCSATSASFRVYADVSLSFMDHGYQLASLSRYAGAFAYVNNPDEFARAIHRAGYATSPTYADNLIGLMRQYNLYRYDSPL